MYTQSCKFAVTRTGIRYKYIFQILTRFIIQHRGAKSNCTGTNLGQNDCLQKSMPESTKKIMQLLKNALQNDPTNSGPKQRNHSSLLNSPRSPHLLLIHIQYTQYTQHITIPIYISYHYIHPLIYQQNQLHTLTRSAYNFS